MSISVFSLWVMFAGWTICELATSYFKARDVNAGEVLSLLFFLLGATLLAYLERKAVA